MPRIEGFCRPRWDAIAGAIEDEVPQPEWPTAWEAVSRHWVRRLRDQLGGGYRVFETPDFLILTEAPERVSQDACRSYEAALKGIRDRLEGVALGEGYGKHVVLMFGNLEDYYRYISYFYGEGRHPMSGGVCLEGDGYMHFAFPTTDFSSYRTVLVHELTHGCLAHLPLPSWLNEALAMRMEQVVCASGAYSPDLDEFERHANYWNANSIQQFWSGESWNIPGESFDLSYGLARLLWRKIEVDIGASREAVLDFVRTANAEDGGEAASRTCFGVSLADLANGLLGKGDWAPAPQKWPNKSLEPAGASSSGQFKGVGRWPLAPAVHAQR